MSHYWYNPSRKQLWWTEQVPTQQGIVVGSLPWWYDQATGKWVKRTVSGFAGWPTSWINALTLAYIGPTFPACPGDLGSKNSTNVSQAPSAILQTGYFDRQPGSHLFYLINYDVRTYTAQYVWAWDTYNKVWLEIKDKNGVYFNPAPISIQGLLPSGIPGCPAESIIQQILPRGSGPGQGQEAVKRPRIWKNERSAECTQCGGKNLALFTSYYCPRCE